MTGARSLRSVAVERTKRLAGPALTVQVRCPMHGFGFPRRCNLRRTTPFSSAYGFERGTPIDRYYLHRFLETIRRSISHGSSPSPR